jgi:hypothetical protein
MQTNTSIILVFALAQKRISKYGIRPCLPVVPARRRPVVPARRGGGGERNRPGSVGRSSLLVDVRSSWLVNVRSSWLVDVRLSRLVGGGGGKMLKVNARVTLDSSFRLAVSSFTSRPGVNFINIMCTHVFVQVSLLTTFFHFRCLIGKGFAGGLVFELKSSLNILVREEITKQIKLIQPFFVKKVSISSRGKLFMV